MKVYNSLTNKLEKFVPLKEKEVSMYVCGPTVYNHCHIGNARPVVFFDLVYRLFKYLGYKVTYATNYTDIDDKIIKKAIEEGVDATTISTRYIEAFEKVWSDLGCLEPTYRPRVTDTMDQIIDYIGHLIEKGYAYVSGDNVYFRVRKIKEYGILSNQKLDDLESGARIEVESSKEDPLDFVLWKLTDDLGPKWESPFGLGRPGWHTECCVMIDDIFKGSIDIHGAGNDLKFPHHENEIAQSLATNNNTIANYWIHNARIDFSGQKMSKSLGNVIWTKDLINEYGGMIARLLIISNHYRQSINFTTELINQVATEWQKIDRAYLSVYRYLELNDAFNKGTMDILDNFVAELVNDFSTPNAMTVLYQHIKDINVLLRSKEKDNEKIASAFNTLKTMLDILGLVPDVKPLSSEEKEVVLAWQNARNNKDFEKADLLRQQIQELGIKM
ncbi:MAG: cysteine--tRNA ligase [Bacilli bacterium]|nr:cysteine--tRNA ligase [Bacilli bacterium]